MRRSLLCLAFALLVPVAHAAVEDLGTHVRYYGTGTNDNDLLVTSGDVSRYERCWLMSTAGAVDVEATLDGTNWSTDPLALQDFGSVDSSTGVLLTAPGRMYAVPIGGVRKLRVRQNGATASSASLNCWK